MLRDHCERVTVADKHDVPVGELSLRKLVKEAHAQPGERA
jgi:osmoprotectant transport system ATP-binding protein